MIGYYDVFYEGYAVECHIKNMELSSIDMICPEIIKNNECDIIYCQQQLKLCGYITINIT